MKIRVNCVVSVEGMRDNIRHQKRWQLKGHIAAPCLPLEGTNLWFLEDVDAGSNPAIVTDNDTFFETKPGVFEPEIRVVWEIGDYFCFKGASFEQVIASFEKDVLKGLTTRGWRVVCDEAETPCH